MYSVSGRKNRHMTSMIPIRRFQKIKYAGTQTNQRITIEYSTKPEAPLPASTSGHIAANLTRDEHGVSCHINLHTIGAR